MPNAKYSSNEKSKEKQKDQEFGIHKLQSMNPVSRKEPSIAAVKALRLQSGPKTPREPRDRATS